MARIALRGKSSLAVVRVYQDQCLTLETMHFPDEVRSFAGLSLPADTGYREQELEMARMLIGTLATPFAPEKYQDEYREAQLTRIREKIAGEEVVRVEAPAATGRVMDLMEALRQSIQLAEETQAETGVREPAAVTPAAAGAGAPMAPRAARTPEAPAEPATPAAPRPARPPEPEPARPAAGAQAARAPLTTPAGATRPDGPPAPWPGPPASPVH